MRRVRLLGFTTLTCGCVVGKYREVATSREVMYVEEKGKSCGSHSHRRNHTIVADRFRTSFLVSLLAADTHDRCRPLRVVLLSFPRLQGLIRSQAFRPGVLFWAHCAIERHRSSQ